MGQFGRRKFLTALGATALASPLDCLAQLGKTPRIGNLLVDAADSDFSRFRQRLFHESLVRAGYKVGKDVFLEWRFADRKPERLHALADELVGVNVDVIVAWTWLPVHAAKQATNTIPIVMYAYGQDPVERGLIASLARPGGNVTGTTWNFDLDEMIHKQSQILKEAAPTAIRIASLWWPWAPDARKLVDVWNARSNKDFGQVITNFVVENSEEISSALERIAAFKPDALWVSSVSVIRHRYREIAAFATQQKLVTFSDGPTWPQEGGLLYYGPNSSHIVDRTASYVDRILRGARPGDLPVERPLKFELVFNARTARAIGYAIPPALYARADRVIE